MKTLNKELFRSILTLMTGTAAAQLIAIMLQPLLRRLFIPEEFGAYGVYISLVSILATLSTLRYEPAIVQPAKQEEAVNLFFLSFYINLAFNIILFLLVLFFRAPLARFLNIQAEYSGWLLLLPASVLLFGTYQCMNYFLVREKAFKAISANKAARRVSEGGVQLLGGILTWPAALVAGDIAGHLANVLSGMRQMVKASFRPAMHSFSLQGRLFSQYADYPLYYMLPMALNVICMMAPLVLVNKFYSQEMAGYFDLTRLVLITPSALITVSVGQVFLQNVSESKRKGLSFRRDFLHLLQALALPGLLLALVLTFSGPWLLSWYAGAPYEMAGRFSQILVWGTFARILVSPLTMVYVGLRKLKTQALWQVLYFLMIICLVFFRHLPLMQFIWVLTAIEILAYSINFVLIWNISRKYHRSLPEPGGNNLNNP